MEVNGETFTFSSGKEIAANKGIVGINPDLEIYDGYDGQIEVFAYSFEKDSMEPTLTPEEALELSRFMVELWQGFAQKFTSTG
jgi:hypothetical protein